MAELVFTDGTIEIGPAGGALVDLSDHMRSGTVDYSAETPEKIAMGAGTKTRLGGLLDWKIDLEFNQDYGAASVDATLFDLVGTSVDVDICATAEVASATNPHFTGTGIISSYNPLGGKVGDVMVTKVTIVAGSTVLTRDVGA